MKLRNLFLMLLASSLTLVACEDDNKQTDNKPIDDPKYDIEVDMAAAVIIPNDETGLEANKCSIIFGDEAESVALTLTFVGTKNSTTLQAGTYSSTNGNIDLQNSELLLFGKDGSENSYDVEEATVIVRTQSDIYTFDIKATVTDGKKCHFTYEGMLYSTEENDNKIVNSNFACGYTAASGDVANNYYIVLANVEINNEMNAKNATYCVFDLYSDIASGTVPNGTYTLDSKNSGKSGTLGADYTYVYRTNDSGKFLHITEFVNGSVIVTNDRIEAVLMSTDNVVYTITYEGSLTFDTISTLDGDLDLNSSGISFVVKEHDVEIEGIRNTTIELYDDYDTKSGLYMVLDLFWDANAESYNGTYTASYNCTANTFYPGSDIEGYLIGSYYTMLSNNKPTGTMAPLTEGIMTLTVDANGDGVFVIQCKDDKGNKIAGTLTGSRINE